MKQLLAFSTETRGSIWHDSTSLSDPDFLAQVRLLVEAELALFALWRVKWNDVITGLEIGDTFANGLNNSGTFVTENAREKTLWVDS